MIRFRAGLLLSLSWFIIAGCKPHGGADSAPQNKNGPPLKVLRVGNGAEPQFIDPQLETGLPEHSITRAIFEGLVTEGETENEIMPGVAEKWEVSSDGLNYTFHLRSDAKWSDGTPVTVTDFLRGYQRALTPVLGSEYVRMLYVVKGAEDYYRGKIKNFADTGFGSSDPHTLILKLNRPTPFLLSAMRHPAWYPIPSATVEKFKDFDRRDVTWTRPENIVGNGPFRVIEWSQNQKLVVERSPTYWDRAHVKLDRIEFYPIELSETEEHMFRTDQLDITYELPLTKIAIYKRDFPQWLRISPISAVYFYRINTGRKPLNDVRVREALSLAIDRESLVKNVTLGGEKSAYNYVPDNTNGYYGQYKLHSNVAEAQKLLAEAGYPGGRGFPHIQVSYNTLERHRVIAEALQQMWKTNLGIDVGLFNEEWKVFLADKQAINYDIARDGWLADYLDPSQYLDMWKTGGEYNLTNWGSPEYDHLLAISLDTKNDQERFAIYQKMETILLQGLPIIPLYFYVQPRLVGPRVLNYKISLVDSYPWKYVDVRPSARK